MFKIDTATMPTPSEWKIGLMDISKAERNAAGDLMIERIATKRKVELGWAYLSKDDVKTLFAAVSATTFTLEYIDPQTDTTITGTFYAGDRTAAALDYIGSVIRYKDVKVNFVEV